MKLFLMTIWAYLVILCIPAFAAMAPLPPAVPEPLIMLVVGAGFIVFARLKKRSPK